MADERSIESLKAEALLLPDAPGVYQFVDRNGRLLYVGKAKSLKKRVPSYFGKNVAGKTAVMRSRITAIRHIVVDSESEALLLENTLIKREQPRYNVLMKDDKTYPWICIRNEPFPRVYLTRTVIRDGSLYYGPYTSVVMVRTLLTLIRQLYPLRTCSHNLSKERVEAGKYRVCLEYHIGNCKAPCTGNQEEEEYNLYISQVKEILNGNIYTVTAHLRELMKSYAAELKYEEAQVIKEKLETLERYRSRSTVVNPRIDSVDVFAHTSDDSAVYINYTRVVKGAIVQTFTLELKQRLEESLDELMSFAITELRQRYGSDSKEIIVSLMPDIQIDRVKYTLPSRGDRLRLVELAERNAVHYRLNKMKQRVSVKSYSDRSKRVLEQVQADLRLPALPVHIECFDNSNIQGSNPVAACVVFRNGKPSGSEYRHYNIKGVSGPNDFASMEEVVYRRYKRLIEEQQGLPQLIIVDGGKGQLGSAVKSLDRLGIRGEVAIAGIAKRLEEIYFPNDPVPVYIDKNSPALKLIQYLRNEAHRFGINFHRQKRSGSLIISELDSIPGVGPATKELLIKTFGSVEEVRRASFEELKKCVGSSKAEKIALYLKK